MITWNVLNTHGKDLFLLLLALFASIHVYIHFFDIHVMALRGLHASRENRDANYVRIF